MDCGEDLSGGHVLLRERGVLHLSGRFELTMEVLNGSQIEFEGVI